MDTVQLPHPTKDQIDSLKIQGSLIYVRQCARDIEVKVDEKISIYMPDKFEDDCRVCEIMAIGERVGKRRNHSKSELRKMGVRRWENFPGEVGDAVILPDTGRLKRWWRSPYADYDVIVDHDEALAVIKKDELWPT